MMKRLSCVGVALLIASFVIMAPTAAVANSKYAAYVVHANSGDVLFSRYANHRRYPASLTKMMTLYMLFQELEAGRLTLDSKLKVSARAAAQPPSKLGVKAGTTIDVETAIEALVVKSANDVAVVVAEAISGSEWKFARAMTTRARALGMSRTTFRNASGLPNRKQVTTARDLARLSQRLIHDHADYFHYFNKKSFTWNGRVYRTHNALVKTYDGADGLKTGYTRLSGYNLSTTAQRDGNRLIGIVLGGRSSRTRDAHMRKILTESFAAIKKKPTLIADLHRKKPTPSIKPTRLAELEAARQVAAIPTPSIAFNKALQNELLAATDTFDGAATTALVQGNARDPLSSDAISALIAAADSDDFNEFERIRLAAVGAELETWAEGDFDPPTDLSWTVQIGAYSEKALAQVELETAAAAANLTKFHRTVEPVDAPDGVLYRARFTHLSELDAIDACKTIRAANLKCFVLKDGSPAEN